MIAPPETDVKVGMLVYSTTSPRHQVKLRERRDDFRVEEIIDFSEIKNRPVKGYFPVYRVEKSGTDTIHMAVMLANRLKSKISFAGLKDRRAQTIQYISPISSKVKSLDSVVHELFKAELIGYAERPITKRSMIGNSFRIMLRDSSSDLIESIGHVYSKCRERRLPNFFGYQRFGSGGAITHSVGRAILHRNFGEAIRIILCEPREGERETVNEARKLSSAQRYSEAYTMFSGKQDLERRVLQHLLKKKDDFLGALRALPLIIRRLFINGYQSYIFNLTLSTALREGLDISRAEVGDNWSTIGPDGLTLQKVHGSKEIPSEGAVPLVQLPGYAYRDYGSRFDSIISEIMKEEGIIPKQFYLKEAEEMSGEGSFRHAMIIGKAMSYELGERGTTLDFTLSRGEYATSLLREIIKPQTPLESGF